MRVYLGARYSRLEELNGYADELRRFHITVDARWLTGEHGALYPETSVADGDKFAALCAQHDVEDVRSADAVVVFTEPPDGRSPRGRGGVHVEFGLALAWAKPTIVVGHRVNVFHHLPQVVFALDWKTALRQVLWWALNGKGEPQ